jgi:hypothetical protein
MLTYQKLPNKQITHRRLTRRIAMLLFGCGATFKYSN